MSSPIENEITNYNPPEHMKSVVKLDENVLEKSELSLLGKDEEIATLKKEVSETKTRLRKEIESKLELMQLLEGLQEYVGELEDIVSKQTDYSRQNTDTMSILTMSPSHYSGSMSSGLETIFEK